MSRFLPVCLFPLVLLVGCFAPEKNVPEKTVPEVHAPAASSLPKHMFWKISDSNSSVYLLGSVHFADASFYPLDTVITNAFDRSDELAVELDMSDTAVFMEIAQQTELRGKLKDGLSLAQVLPHDVRMQFDSLCIAWYIAPDLLYGYKPWSAAMTLSSLAIMKLGFDPNLGIDFYFLQGAQESRKKVVSLESAEDQIAVLVGDGVSDSLGIYYLKNTISEMQLMDSSVTLMMRAWKTGNDSLFREALNMEPEGSATDSLLDAQIEEFVYIARNRTMADSIAAFLAQDRKVFVVVGAAHMAGEGDNVLKLLRDRGLTVEQR